MAKANPKPAVKKVKKTKTRQPGRIANWCEENFKTASYVIIGIAFLLRAWLLVELPNMPFSETHRAPNLDMNFFDQWGERIANGDFLTDTIFHPYHDWHQQAAQAYGLKNDQEAKEHWNEVYGGTTYHQEPLYALLLGICNILLDDGHLLMYILQMIASLLSILMIIWLGKHYFGAIAGLSAGLLFTLYSPGIFFDVILLRTSLTTCYVLSLLYVSEKLILGKSKPWIFGVLGGVGYLLQTTTLLLWIPLLIRWLYLKRADIKIAWQAGVGIAAVLSLLVTRNVIAGAPPLSASSVGPVTYVLSNFPAYEPKMGFAVFLDILKVMERTDGKMLASMEYIIARNHSFMHWVGLQFNKLALVFDWYEIPNNVNHYAAMPYSIPLQIAFIPWSIIAALGTAAMLFTIWRRKTMSLLFGVLSQVAVMVAFYVLCRFRVPMVALMAIYAGYVIQEVVLWENKKRALILAVSSIVCWIIIARNTPYFPVKFRSSELAVYFHTYYKPKMDALVAKGDLAGCIRLEEQFLSSAPKFVYAPDIAQQDNDKKDLARFYGNIYGDLGDFYKDTGNQQKANECFAMMKRLNPGTQK